MVAVRGNNDQDAWTAAIPETTIVEVDGYGSMSSTTSKPLTLILPLRILGGDLWALAPATLRTAGRVWFINPGSAGPRRFTLPVTVARLYVHAGTLTPELVELPV